MNEDNRNDAKTMENQQYNESQHRQNMKICSEKIKTPMIGTPNWQGTHKNNNNFWVCFEIFAGNSLSMDSVSCKTINFNNRLGLVNL